MPGALRCSRLCLILTAIGLTASTTASLFTRRALLEPLTAAVLLAQNHHASSSCTAISRSLTALLLASSAAGAEATPADRTPPDRYTTVGVLNQANGTLLGYHSASLSSQQALATLRALPLARQPAETARPATQPGGSKRCEELHDGLDPAAVRVHRLPGRSNGWLALIYGPWLQQGQPHSAFALVDLQGSSLAISGHAARLEALIPGGHGTHLAMRVSLLDGSALPEPDPGPDGRRIMRFANGNLISDVDVDQSALAGIANRSAALVFLFGLLATAGVVLMSRASAIQLQRLNQALMRESRTDGLTRIANRRAWDEALAREEKRRQRVRQDYGLLVVDLDGFKLINDQLGHQIGDQVLQTTASQLASQLRGTDVLARVGGDEFALLVFSPNASGLDDLRSRLQRKLTAAGIQASIGTAMSEQGSTLEQTWAKADAAMYAIKRNAMRTGRVEAEPPEASTLDPTRSPTTDRSLGGS